MEYQLLWHIGIDDYEAQYGHQPSQYRAPSWSWAALKAPYIYPFKRLATAYFQKFTIEYYCAIHIIGYSLQPKYQGDIFSELNGASITIQCSSLKKMPRLEFNRRGEIEQLYNGTETFQVRLDTEENESGPRFLLFVLTFEARQSSDSTYLWPYGITGLLLEKADHHIDCFRRVGIFWIDGYPSPRSYRLEEGWGTFRDCDNNPPPWMDNSDSQSCFSEGDEFSDDSTTQGDRQSWSRFRSSIWSRLEDAEMSWEAQERVTLDPTNFSPCFLIWWIV